MNEFNYKKFIVYIGLLFIILILIVYFINNNENMNKDQKNKTQNIVSVSEEQINMIYSYLTNVDCNKSVIWDFSKIKSLTIDKMSSEFKTTLVFSYIDSIGKLNEKLTKKDFYNYASQILGKVEADKLEIVNQEYNSKLYFITENGTDINNGTKCGTSDYVSKLLSYEIEDNVLYLKISVSIIKDNNVYDTNNNKIGSFENNQEKDSLLKLSSIYKYGFVKLNDHLVLYNITSL